MRAVVFILMAASAAFGQTTRLPDVCTDADIFYCELFNIDPCPCRSASEPVRISPINAPSVQHGVDYILPKETGVHALNYKDSSFESWTDYAESIHVDGFTTQQLWVDVPPYCPGHWEPPFPSHVWIQDEYGCDFEWIMQHGPIKYLFLRVGVTSWMVNEGQGCYIMDTAPLGFIVNRLYDMAWYRDITVVLVPWEQDWYPRGCPGSTTYSNYIERLDWLIGFESERQRQVEQTRRAKMKQYPGARLQVLHAMVVNKFPGYNIPADELDLPTVSDAIGQMVEDPALFEPDLVGISYWKRGLDPVPALDYVKNATHYPKNRLFIAEFGAKRSEQPQRYLEYIPVFWEWGIRSVLVWVYKDYWGQGGNYTITPEGLDALRKLNNEAN